ncbi:MAG TPA: CBS domain-containing protein [Anaerolineaceae bacterium]|nr:CBS domain-containing protein [Anaerolineaceae bacterium]
MQLIMTHEQADLDALASMLGAHLLVPEAYALLPRQINRNGRDFLDKYGEELGFSRLKDLPHKEIKKVYLVDTQSLVTLRGMTDETKVVVIDHHLRKKQSHSDWEMNLQTSGACSTLLVEKIQAAGLELTNLEATLLILGIYEDTGSLGYSNTTARDARAVAFLLEQGADLNLVSRYLNPPLTNAQQQLFDRLVANLTTHTIEGFEILVASADAFDLNDEISSVAHKLRDFMDPDGIVLVVSTRQGVRLVARSTTDNLDVGLLARHFNGGGHKRASSALIRPGDKPNPENTRVLVQKTVEELLRYLPVVVTPELKVRQIMSRDPLILDPSMAGQEAARLMNRYGFEGYPVVRDGKVIGLLNRRNVDRALQHNLEKSVEDLMEAGEIRVFPEDSLSRLKEIMANTGWGQVPVVDPESGDVIGIVTRTDLIGTLHTNGVLLPQSEMVKALEEALSAERKTLLLEVAEQARLQKIPAYIVGGFVRDLLLKRPSQDFDIVLEGNAIEFADYLVATYGGRAVVHRRFGTAKWILSEDREAILSKLGISDPGNQALPEHLDLISARTEFYDHPAALPVVERSSIKMDLHRRDFTINTLALRLDGEHFGQIFDFWGGYDDLMQKQIRVLHALSFVDDATRMLRAVRFAERFDFEIETRTLSLLKASLPLIDQLSGARIQHELDLIFQEKKVSEIMRTLQNLGVLAAIHPQLGWSPTQYLRVQTIAKQVEDGWLNLEDLKAAIWMLWLEVYPAETLTAVCTRLRLKSQLVEKIRQTARLRALLPAIWQLPPSQITEKLSDFTEMVIRTVMSSSEDENQLQPLRDYLDTYQRVKAHTTGEDLKARGLTPSPRYDTILKELKAAWLDGKINTYEEEISLLERLIEAE